MSVNIDKYKNLLDYCFKKQVKLIVVSKTQSIEDILTLYNLGQRDFGENYIQELIEKKSVLPNDIQWHCIGHVQTNKVKYIASFIKNIQTVDSEKLIQEINKQALKNNRIIPILIQIKTGIEESKTGLDSNQLDTLILNSKEYKNIFIEGLMTIGSLTSKTEQTILEFKNLYQLYKKYPQFKILSMGMSNDYEIAIEQGANLIRVGSLLFEKRE